MTSPLASSRFEGALASGTLVAEKTLGPPPAGYHEAKEEHFDSYGGQWLCVVSGTPGTWIRVNAVTGGAVGTALTKTIITAEAIAQYDIVSESGYKFRAKFAPDMRMFAGMASTAQPMIGAPLVVWMPETVVINPAWSWPLYTPLYVDVFVTGGLTPTPPDGTNPLGGEGRLQVAMSGPADTITLVEREPFWFPFTTPPT